MIITAKDEPTFREAGNSGGVVAMFGSCRKIKQLDLTPFKPMLEVSGYYGWNRICNGMTTVEKIIIPSMTTNLGSSGNYSDHSFTSAGQSAGMEILNPGSGLSAGTYQTTTDTGDFQIYLNSVDSSGGAIQDQIRVINVDNSWSKNAVFNFAGGLQIKLTTEKPGCEFIMKDIIFSHDPRLRYSWYNAIVSEINLSNWTFPSIGTMSQWFYLNNAGYDSVVNMDNWSTTGNGVTAMNSMMTGNRYDKANRRGPKILKTTNWDASVTENLTNFGSLGNTSSGRYSRLREWHGLNNIKLGKVTNFERMFEFMYYLHLKSENGRNFSDTCMDNRVSTPTSLSCNYLCNSVGGNAYLEGDTSDMQPPNLTGWNFNASNPVNLIQAFYQMAMPNDDANTLGGISWDLSSVDLSNINNLSAAFRRINYVPTSGANRPSGAQTIKVDSFSSTCTNMNYLSQQSTVTNWDLRGSDLSSVTDIQRVFGEEISALNNFRFQFDNTVNLNAVTAATGFLNYSGRVLNASDYENMLRAFSTTSNTGVRIDLGGTTFGAGLIFTSARTPEQMTSTATANKVVDTNKNFNDLGVSVGDIVEVRRSNANSNIALAEITNVAETELTLSDSIILDNNYRFYNIQTSQAAKNRFTLIGTNNWIINDSGPTIN